VAKLIYTAITSLDGYIEDETSKFDWAEPDEEVHACINDLERPSARTSMGAGCTRRWSAGTPTPVSPPNPPHMRDFAQIWRAADKIVYSTGLETVIAARTDRTRL
jgi:hypothetical protein